MKAIRIAVLGAGMAAALFAVVTVGVGGFFAAICWAGGQCGPDGFWREFWFPFGVGLVWIGAFSGFVASICEDMGFKPNGLRMPEPPRLPSFKEWRKR